YPACGRERADVRVSLGRGDVHHFSPALPLYYRFMEMDAEIFDNTRLLQEGMAPAPKVTSYLEMCATRPADRSVYDQMLNSSNHKGKRRECYSWRSGGRSQRKRLGPISTVAAPGKRGARDRTLIRCGALSR